MEKIIDFLMALLVAMALPCLLLALVLQPIWQRRREQKMADELKAILHDSAEQEKVAIASAFTANAIAESLEIARDAKSIRRG